MRSLPMLGALLLVAAALGAAGCGDTGSPRPLAWTPPPPDLGGGAALQSATADDSAGNAAVLLRPATFVLQSHGKWVAYREPAAWWQRCAAAPAQQRHACLHELMNARG